MRPESGATNSIDAYTLPDPQDQRSGGISDDALLDRLFRQTDKMQADLDLHAARDEYLERHPETAQGVRQANESNRKQGKAHVETNSVLTFVKFVAKAAKDRGQTGMSATALNRRLARVDYLGRDYFGTMVAQPRRRPGLLGFISELATDKTELSQDEREEQVETWLAEEPAPRRKSDDETTWQVALDQIESIIQSLNDRERDQIYPALRSRLNEVDAQRYG